MEGEIEREWEGKPPDTPVCSNTKHNCHLSRSPLPRKRKIINEVLAKWYVEIEIAKIFNVQHH